MYGEGTNSPLQGDMPTDRFVVTWAVDPAAIEPPLDRIPDGTPVAVGDGGEEIDLPTGAQVAVRAPRDIATLATADIAGARRWRFATRRALTHYLATGYRVRGFAPDPHGGAYLLVRK
jgi:predicted GNAT superfamily acetyltransferase